MRAFVARAAIALATLSLLTGCEAAVIAPPPPGVIAFAVFGDAPYYPWETMRYHRALREIDGAQLSWLLHLGDLFWRPCSNEMMAERRADFDAMRTPVIYVPGDNEWTDCHSSQTGRFDPLDRLTQLRRTVLSAPTQSLGATPLTLESQATNAQWPEFAEHRRWRRGGVTFATLHLVGSDNGLAPFAARTALHDNEVVRRTAAALAWMRETFDSASANDSRLVVLAWHGNPGFNTPQGARRGYDEILDTLRVRASGYPGQILVIHGDSHDQHVDHPLFARDGKPIANVTRLESFGSPDIGWVQVNVDTARGALLDITPHKIPKRAFVF